MNDTHLTDARGVSLQSAGFSVVEVLIAAAVLLIVAIGILPMFTRSITNNAQGQIMTQTVHRAKSELEELIQADFNSAALTVGPGEEFGDPARPGKETVEMYSRRTEKWIPEASFPTGEDPAFIRTIRVRQYNLASLESSENSADWEPLDGSAPDNQVHLKEIEVVVATPERGGILGPGRQLTLRMYKSF